MWLKDLRKQAGITQEDLAARLQTMGFDYSRSSINNWERNGNPAPMDDPRFVRALARALKTSPPMLLKSAGFELEAKHSEIAERVAALMDTLPDDKQQLALKLVEALAG